VSSARRYRLAEMREPWVRRQFNLRRAVLELELPQAEGRPVRLLNTHLSAFSMGDGSLPVQVGQVLDRLREAERAGLTAICGGDWNALPPGDDPHRLGADAALYSDDGWPLAPLFADWTSAVTLEQHRDEPERWRTWLPRDTDAPDRAIDHLFASRDLEVLDSTVLRGDPGASDHLPLLVELAPR
jgi:endonuclease/exonuclease/phosphatase family metal-dependent hydrolase